MRVASVLALLVVSTVGAFAQEARPAGVAVAPTKERETLDGFARANPACLEWSDGCATCLRHDATYGCSLPGIACQPGVPACRDQAGTAAPKP